MSTSSKARLQNFMTSGKIEMVAFGIMKRSKMPLKNLGASKLRKQWQTHDLHKLLIIDNLITKILL